MAQLLPRPEIQASGHATAGVGRFNRKAYEWINKKGKHPENQKAPFSGKPLSQSPAIGNTGQRCSCDPRECVLTGILRPIWLTDCVPELPKRSTCLERQVRYLRLSRVLLASRALRSRSSVHDTEDLPVATSLLRLSSIEPCHLWSTISNRLTKADGVCLKDSFAYQREPGLLRPLGVESIVHVG